MNGARRDLVTGLAHQIPSLLDVPMEGKKESFHYHAAPLSKMYFL
jgi:hypothetical protein